LLLAQQLTWSWKRQGSRRFRHRWTSTTGMRFYDDTNRPNPVPANLCPLAGTQLLLWYVVMRVDFSFSRGGVAGSGMIWHSATAHRAFPSTCQGSESNRYGEEEFRSVWRVVGANRRAKVGRFWQPAVGDHLESGGIPSVAMGFGAQVRQTTENFNKVLRASHSLSLCPSFETHCSAADKSGL
jgi:hypothetical protein